jgi:hypothetical protein
VIVPTASTQRSPLRPSSLGYPQFAYGYAMVDFDRSNDGRQRYTYFAANVFLGSCKMLGHPTISIG